MLQVDDGFDVSIMVVVFCGKSQDHSGRSGRILYSSEDIARMGRRLTHMLYNCSRAAQVNFLGA